jgi:hypothetical protein
MRSLKLGCSQLCRHIVGLHSVGVVMLGIFYALGHALFIAVTNIRFAIMLQNYAFYTASPNISRSFFGNS